MAKRGKPAWLRALSRLAFRAVVWIVLVPVRLLPFRGVQRLGGALGAFGHAFLASRRRRIADENLRGAFGDELGERERRRIIRACLVNMIKMMLELFKLPQLTPEDIRALVQFEGREHLRAAHAQGRGILILSAHFGNFEFGAARLRAEGYEMSVMARDAPDAPTAKLVNSCRESHGTRVLSREALREALRCLRRGELLGIVADQHQAEGGIVVNFFDRPAATALGPARIAARTGAPVLPLFVVRQEDDTFRMRVEAPVELVDTGDRDADVHENTQRLQSALEAGIRRNPEQWFWVHRRWKILEDDA